MRVSAAASENKAPRIRAIASALSRHLHGAATVSLFAAIVLAPGTAAAAGADGRRKTGGSRVAGIAWQSRLAVLFDQGLWHGAFLCR